VARASSGSGGYDPICGGGGKKGAPARGSALNENGCAAMAHSSPGEGSSKLPEVYRKLGKETVKFESVPATKIARRGNKGKKEGGMMFSEGRRGRKGCSTK